MQAKVGDTLHIRARQIDLPDQVGRIVEIRGADGAPPYLVEFTDGHVSLIFPGLDAIVGPEAPAERRAPVTRRGRRLHTRHGW